MYLHIVTNIPTDTHKCVYICVYVYTITGFYSVFKRYIEFRHSSVIVTRVLSKCLRPSYTKIDTWAVLKSGLGVFRFKPK